MPIKQGVCVFLANGEGPDMYCYYTPVKTSHIQTISSYALKQTVRPSSIILYAITFSYLFNSGSATTILAIE